MTFQETIRNIIASELGTSPRSIPDEAAIEVTEKWDSLTHISICLAVQSEFGIEMSMQDIASANSLAALTALVTLQKK